MAPLPSRMARAKPSGDVLRWQMRVEDGPLCWRRERRAHGRPEGIWEAVIRGVGWGGQHLVWVMLDVEGGFASLSLGYNF